MPNLYTISLSQLSQLTNLSQAYLRKLENNNPTISSLLKVSEALNVNIKQLFYTKLDIDELNVSIKTKASTSHLVLAIVFFTIFIRNFVFIIL